MPWSETNEVEQRLQFVTEWKRGETSMSALCRVFGVSRPTGYKWVARYFEDGDEGGVFMLQNRSRAPMSQPHTTDACADVTAAHHGRTRRRSADSSAQAATAIRTAEAARLAERPRTSTVACAEHDR